MPFVWPGFNISLITLPNWRTLTLKAQCVQLFYNIFRLFKSLVTPTYTLITINIQYPIPIPTKFLRGKIVVFFNSCNSSPKHSSSRSRLLPYCRFGEGLKSKKKSFGPFFRKSKITSKNGIFSYLLTLPFIRFSPKANGNVYGRIIRMFQISAQSVRGISWLQTDRRAGQLPNPHLFRLRSPFESFF